MDAADVETSLVDVRNSSLEQVRQDVDERRLSLDTLLKQVERPRLNIGGSSPPGRAD